MGSQNGLVKTIEIKDRHGRVIETREVVTYAGLLNRAHQEGLKSIRTRLIQAPTEANQMTAISMAEIVTDRGVYRDYGDANPGNVNSKIAPHIIRMAVTRAKARALRDAINVGVVSLEELGQEYTNGNGGQRNGQTQDGEESEPRRQRRQSPPDAEKPMSESQRKYLFRLLDERGVSGDEAERWIHEALQVVSLKAITKPQASGLIDHLLQSTQIPEQKPN
jgi:hypothetical protein